MTGVPVVVSTLTQRELYVVLIEALRSHRYAGRVAVTADNHADAQAVERAGAGVVLMPFVDAAGRAVEALAGGD